MDRCYDAPIKSESKNLTLSSELCVSVLYIKYTILCAMHSGDFAIPFYITLYQELNRPCQKFEKKILCRMIRYIHSPRSDVKIL